MSPLSDSVSEFACVDTKVRCYLCPFLTLSTPRRYAVLRLIPHPVSFHTRQALCRLTQDRSLSRPFWVSFGFFWGGLSLDWNVKITTHSAVDGTQDLRSVVGVRHPQRTTDIKCMCADLSDRPRGKKSEAQCYMMVPVSQS